MVNLLNSDQIYKVTVGFLVENEAYMLRFRSCQAFFCHSSLVHEIRRMTMVNNFAKKKTLDDQDVTSFGI